MFTTIFEVLSNALCYVGYIRSNSFQQPLDKEEEARCISLLSERDEEARNKLIEHNLRLVAHIVKRSSKNYFQNVSLNEPIATDKDGSEITLIDAISSPEDSSIIDDMIVEDNIARLKRYIHVLDARELEIITKRFGLYGQEEETQREIARQLHISRSYVSRIEKRAFMKIYREFQKEETRKERQRQNREKE